MKPKKKRYRFELTKDGEKPRKEYFFEYDDARAINTLRNLLPALLPGSTVVLSRWDKKKPEWVFVRRGGKDNPATARLLF